MRHLLAAHRLEAMNSELHAGALGQWLPPPIGMDEVGGTAFLAKLDQVERADAHDECVVRLARAGELQDALTSDPLTQLYILGVAAVVRI